MDTRPDAVEEVHKIHGTGISFSSDDLDEKAEEVLREIRQKGVDGLEVYGDVFEMDPQRLPKGFFLSGQKFYYYLRDLLSSSYTGEHNCFWRKHGHSLTGYGIGDRASGYGCFKNTFVYHKGNHKTNWIMNVYNLIYENSFIKADGVVLCHVFQSDNYNPRPNRFPKSVPNFFDFHEKEVDSHMLRLENLMKNPESFKDFYELDEIYSKRQANGRNGKRAGVWEHFTPIKVLGPDGKVMLTLAICHHCSMAYLTGKWDSKKGEPLQQWYKNPQ